MVLDSAIVKVGFGFQPDYCPPYSAVVAFEIGDFATWFLGLIVILAVAAWMTTRKMSRASGVYLRGWRRDLKLIFYAATNNQAAFNRERSFYA